MLPQPSMFNVLLSSSYERKFKEIIQNILLSTPQTLQGITCDLKTKSMLLALMVKAPQDLTG